MNYETARFLPRDSVLYRLLKGKLKDFASANKIANYGEYFADVLCYSSKSAQNQFLMSIAEESFRKLSLDEFKILVDTLGLDASSIINRLLDQTGLVCVHANAPAISDIKEFSIIQAIKTGELSKTLLAALSDGSIDSKEKADIYQGIDALMCFLGSLRATVEEY